MIIMDVLTYLTLDFGFLMQSLLSYVEVRNIDSAICKVLLYIRFNVWFFCGLDCFSYKLVE